MNVSEYKNYDGVGLAQLVKKGEVSAKELARTALKIAEEFEPDIGALIATFDDDVENLRDSSLPEGPFKGLPIIIKDCLIMARGKPVANGSRVCDGLSAPYDTELMTRLRAAGVVPIGIGKCPEFGYNVTTEPVRFGPVHNPWKLGYSAGGSSGGSAAAVSAGYVPLAHGNDGGGSIRIPASQCGLVGLKVTRGRTSMAPDIGEALFGMGSEGFLSRSLRDTAAMLDAVNGSAPGDPYQIPAPARPYVDELKAEMRPAKIAVAVPKHWTRHSISPEVEKAVNAVGRILEDLGHNITEDCFNHSPGGLAEAINLAWIIGETAWIKGVSQFSGIEPGPETLERAMRNIYREGLELDAVSSLSTIWSGFNSTCRSVAPFFEEYDYFVLPTLAKPPIKLGVLNQNADIDSKKWWDAIEAVAPFTAIFNVTGQPSISLPLCQSRNGMPIGIQIVSKFGNEGGLLRLAAQLEQAMPWTDRHPDHSIWNR
ncbi:amidase [Roseibium sp. SCP14]|uniref:amidase n=1 Tax=Roseibium sp. SCP14 TaxID=3141375 RepID=UPI003338EBCA